MLTNIVSFCTLSHCFINEKEMTRTESRVFMFHMVKMTKPKWEISSQGRESIRRRQICVSSVFIEQKPTSVRPVYFLCNTAGLHSSSTQPLHRPTTHVYCVTPVLQPCYTLCRVVEHGGPLVRHVRTARRRTRHRQPQEQLLPQVLHAGRRRSVAPRRESERVRQS